MSDRTVELRVPPDLEGRRLDRFLAEQLPDHTRSAIRRLIDEARVLIDGEPAGKAGQSLRAGTEVIVRIPPPPTGGPRPESIDLPILHRDDDVVVIDKPAGIVVHPGAGCVDGTVVNGLIGMGLSLSSVGAPDRPGIVHRLDRDTSGVLVVARTDAAHHALARAFADRSIRKRYVAVVWGHPDPPEGRIEREIGRSRANPTRMATGATRGKRRPALTVYRTRESITGFAVLDLDLHTGRTHQIRVHLQSIHHPVVGDERYGGQPWRGVQDRIKRAALRRFDRLALHAAILEFDHPRDGRPMRFEAPLPGRMHDLIDVLKKGRS